MDLVNAQQARRVLDRLVGYSISPILWEKVRGRLSAGRVQSVALRLIVEREREIEEFMPVEYWSIHAEFKPEESQIHRSLPNWRRLMIKTRTCKRRSGQADPGRYGNCRVRGDKGQARRTQTQTICAVHHLHFAAGSLAQTWLYRQAHDGSGAGIV